jgi:hypothetical protein
MSRRKKVYIDVKVKYDSWIIGGVKKAFPEATYLHKMIEDGEKIERVEHELRLVFYKRCESIDNRNIIRLINEGRVEELKKRAEEFELCSDFYSKWGKPMFAPTH